MKFRADAADAVFGSVVFYFDGIDYSLFNTVRHALFKDVPVLAPDTVTFIQYDGPLEPEMVAHRIGQLPLRVLPTAGTEPHGADAEYIFRIHKEADTSKAGIIWVTSKDVSCVTGNAEVVHYRTAAEEALAAYDHGFLLVALHPGQRVHATFRGRVSTGREATRWVSSHCAARTDPSFSMRVETTGSVTPPEALKLALKSLLDRLKRLHASF
jgi:DNA-directed RNA polymerase alpha subunit